MLQDLPRSFHHWLQTYKADNVALLESDPEFDRWLEKEYVPISGGWQY